MDIHDPVGPSKISCNPSLGVDMPSMIQASKSRGEKIIVQLGTKLYQTVIICSKKQKGRDVSLFNHEL